MDDETVKTQGLNQALTLEQPLIVEGIAPITTPSDEKHTPVGLRRTRRRVSRYSTSTRGKSSARFRSTSSSRFST